MRRAGGDTIPSEVLDDAFRRPRDERGADLAHHRRTAEALLLRRAEVIVSPQTALRYRVERPLGAGGLPCR
jgi:hypothetical protein